jgi:hypothetical protein
MKPFQDYMTEAIKTFKNSTKHNITEGALPSKFGRNFAEFAVRACSLDFKPRDAIITNINAGNIKALLGSQAQRVGRFDGISVEFKNANERIVFIVYTNEAVINGKEIIDINMHVMGKNKKFMGPVQTMSMTYEPNLMNLATGREGRALKDAYQRS